MVGTQILQLLIKALIIKHVNTEEHRTFAENSENYVKIDALRNVLHDMLAGRSRAEETAGTEDGGSSEELQVERLSQRAHQLDLKPSPSERMRRALPAEE